MGVLSPTRHENMNDGNVNPGLINHGLLIRGGTPSIVII